MPNTSNTVDPKEKLTCDRCDQPAAVHSSPLLGALCHECGEKMMEEIATPEKPLTIHDLDCVGVLPGLDVDGSIHVLYCLVTDKQLTPVVHVKIKAPGSEANAGIRRLDGKELVRDNSDPDNLRVIGDDAVQQARKLMLALNVFHAESEKLLVKMGLIVAGTGEIN